MFFQRFVFGVSCSLALVFLLVGITSGEETAPHLVVTDSSGQPCLLATLNATLKVSYRVYEYMIHQNYLATADVQVPADVRAQGVCGQNVSYLALNWGNDTLQVSLTFTKQNSENPDVNSTWSLTGLSVSYNLSNTHVFPCAADNGIMTVKSNKLILFKAPVGVAYECTDDLTVPLGDSEVGVRVLFHNIKVATFNVSSEEFPSRVQRCQIEAEHDSDEINYLMPIYVAAFLVSFSVIIVIAYVIINKRRDQKARDQSLYRPM